MRQENIGGVIYLLMVVVTAILAVVAAETTPVLEAFIGLVAGLYWLAALPFVLLYLLAQVV